MIKHIITIVIVLIYVIDEPELFLGSNLIFVIYNIGTFYLTLFLGISLYMFLGKSPNLHQVAV